jgi:hypothetical protein
VQLSPPPKKPHKKPKGEKARVGTTTTRLTQHAQQTQHPLNYDACNVHDDHNPLPWPQPIPRVARSKVEGVE